MKDKPELISDTLQEPMYPVNYISDYWASPSNGHPSEDLSTPIVKPIINAHTISANSTYQPPSSINLVLMSCKKSQGYTEDDYLPLDAKSPSHLAARQGEKVWVVEGYGQFRGYGHPGQVKITTGMAVHLVDGELSCHTLGFKMFHLLGIVGQFHS